MSHASISPRLFFSADDLPSMRRHFVEGERFADMRESLENFDRAAEQVFLESEINFEDQCHHIRRVCDVMQNMAFWHLMTGHEGARDLAFQATRTLMKYPCWDFFLSDGKVLGVQGAPRGAIAMASVLDWLGDLVDANERKEWLQALVAKGCEPCFLSLYHIRYPRKATNWEINPQSIMHAQRSVYPTDNARRPEITQNTNLRAAPLSGLSIASAALNLYAEQKPAEMENWLEMCTTTLTAMEAMYVPDGAYGEGVNYGNYTSESIFMAIVALRRSGLGEPKVNINWPGNAKYMLNMAMPTHDNPYEVINIGDAGRHRGHAVFQHPDGRAESRSAVPFWVAKEYRDGSAQWFGENLAAAHNIWSLIFYDESVAPVAPENKPQVWYSDLDWIVARKGFRAEDLQVSLRSGIGWNHEHADRNSIIIKGHGDQLIVDPIRPPYPFTDPDWMMRTTAGHSAILVDGEGHFYNNGSEGTNSTHAQAKLLQHEDAPGSTYWISDATQAYRIAHIEIKNVVRAVVVLFDLETVLVVDRLAKWKEPAKFEARFFADNWEGDATVSTGADGFTIARPHGYAQAKVWSREALTVREDKLPIPAERAAKHPFVAVETASTMLTTLVTAIAVGKTGEAAAAVSFEADDDGVTVTIESTQGSKTCRIDDRELVPVIEIND